MSEVRSDPYVMQRLRELGVKPRGLTRKAIANEARIVKHDCQHYWKPDAFGDVLMVCHNCWSTRLK
jgi:hypothetical protein